MSRRAAAGLALLAAGAIMLAWYIQSKGAADVLAGLQSVGWWFAAILALSLLRFLARTRAWLALIDTRVPTAPALAAVIAGDALGNVTPFGLLASEPAKAMYLARFVAPARALAALTAENFFYTISIAIYIVVGTGSMVEFFALPDAVRLAAWLALGLMAAGLAGAAWMAWQRPMIATAMAARIPLPPVRKMVDRIRDFELQAYGSTGGHSGTIATVVSWHAFFHLLSFTEAWLTLWLLTGESLPVAALVLDTFQRISNILFKMVPFQLGVLQVGSEIVGTAIGLPRNAGLQMSLVRTARVIVWAMVGLASGAAASRDQ